jgi:hypothetical protein
MVDPEIEVIKTFPHEACRRDRDRGRARTIVLGDPQKPSKRRQIPSDHSGVSLCYAEVNTGRKTGFWLEELAAPYYAFEDAGAPLSPKSLINGTR